MQQQQRKQQQQQRFGSFRAAVVALLLALARSPDCCAASVPMAAVKAAARCSAAPDAVDCLLRAAAAGVDALARSDEPVELVPGCVALVRSAGESEGPRTPGQSSNEVQEAAEDALVDSVTAFARSRAISLRAPDHLLHSLKTALTEARGKKDKYAGPLLMGAMMVAGTLLPIKLGALAMMSGKALMTSLLALMLAAILALKKLASGGGGGGGGGGSHGGTTYEVINVPAHPAHGRSLAHSLAYGLPVDPTAAADVPGRR